MTKSQLIDIITEKAKLPRKRAEEVVEMIFDQMTGALLKGDRVEIRGLGSFSVRHYEAYNGRNPRSGAPIQVRPKKLPFFKVGKELRDLVDSKPKSP